MDRMSATLSEVERRVLGVLIEKALAQPQYYPMTVNAIVAACNQKNNRDPVMELDEEAVWNSLEVLRAANLVSRVMPGGASRVERYKQETLDVLKWEKPLRAVMAELLLRGPQTVGELRGRCARMCAFENTESVQAVLETLSQMTPAYVGVLPRAPGQAAVRYAHKLYTDAEWERLARKEAAGAGSASAASAPPTSTSVERDESATRASSGITAAHAPILRADLENIVEQLGTIHQAIEELRGRVANLERLFQ